MKKNFTGEEHSTSEKNYLMVVRDSGLNQPLVRIITRDRFFLTSEFKGLSPPKKVQLGYLLLRDNPVEQATGGRTFDLT